MTKTSPLALRSIWDATARRPVEHIPALAGRIASPLPLGGAVIPRLRNQGRFLACLRAAVERRAVCVFASHPRPQLIPQLEEEFGSVMVVSDEPEPDSAVATLVLDDTLPDSTIAPPPRIRGCCGSTPRAAPALPRPSTRPGPRSPKRPK